MNVRFIYFHSCILIIKCKMGIDWVRKMCNDLYRVNKIRDSHNQYWAKIEK